jgi:PilZ domain
MFVPGDPRFDEILKLAGAAKGEGLKEVDRPRWRTLVGLLLGELVDRGSHSNRRRVLRAAVELQVDILAPEEIASLTTSSVSSGGLALRIENVLPIGTHLDLSIKIEDRKMPLFVRAQVVYSKFGETGAAFVDLFPAHRELLEATVVTAILAESALQ